MNLRMALAAATILALPVAANAQAIDGLYIGGAAGINIMQPEHMTLTIPGFGSGSKDFSSGIGPAGVISLGYGFGNGLRAEVEGDWRYNSFSGSGYGGKEQKYGVMVNALYDFVGVMDGITPYVGVGVGYMEAQESGLHATYSGATASAKTSSEGSFAYQAILGASVPLTAVPGLSLTADYRFLGMTDSRTYTGVSGSVGGPAVALPGASVKASNDYNHTILIGLRYAFGAPAAAAPAPMPAAAPVPAAAASRSYLVFFDWDKAVLTDRARSIVAEAAANSHKVQTTRIEVNGYTDSSGTPKYNMGLSVRRANAVAAELVKDGVPKSEIAIQGFGETHPLVPTGPNVREPQNRRVEIILK